jgi:diphosphomevalonate decarboxylase
MKPNTLEVINKIWKYRQENASNICFTLDAGANIHVLYPFSEREKVNQFIDSQLSKYCQKNQYICDTVGFGAKKL